jgi:hypothetical protein
MPSQMGDQTLAALMQKLKARAPVEEITLIDWPATALSISAGSISADKHIVILACGHTEATRATKRAACRACHAMILNGEDYDGWRNRR